MSFLEYLHSKKNNIKFFLFISVLFSLPYLGFAQCEQPEYCDRDCWDPSGSCPTQNTPSLTDVTHIIVHHSGDGIVFPANTDYTEIVRFYWDLHVNTNGWDDIGYNWLIDRNGVIYEGRGNGVQGAHFSGHNSGTMGVVVIGDFTLETPSEDAITSLESLIAWEATDKLIDVTTIGYHASSDLNLHHVSGHKDGGSTACPGTNLYSLLPSIRTHISNLPCYNISANSSLEMNNLNIYPNPSSKFINIETDKNLSLYRYNIYDLKGRKVKGSNTIRLNQIDISNLKSGMYILHIINNEDKKIIFKFTKE